MLPKRAKHRYFRIFGISKDSQRHKPKKSTFWFFKKFFSYYIKLSLLQLLPQRENLQYLQLITVKVLKDLIAR